MMVFGKYGGFKMKSKETKIIKKIDGEFKMKRWILVSFILLFMFIQNQRVLALSGLTHKLVSKYALFNSKTFYYIDELGNYFETKFLKEIGYENGIKTSLFQYSSLSSIFKFSIEDIIFQASIDEDKGPAGLIGDLKNDWMRSSNHFHNPLALNWDEGKLSDGPTQFHGDNAGYRSAIIWAQSISQQLYMEGDNSWGTIRNNYYTALTETNKEIKAIAFSSVFKGLGHQIHLIEDMSVPDHVRNDSHFLNGTPFNIFKRARDSYRAYEGWEANNRPYIEENIFKQTGNIRNLDDFRPKMNLQKKTNTFLGLPLISISELIDTDTYLGNNPSKSLYQGLAEYTNGNFLSEDTVFTSEEDFGQYHEEGHRFPYPKLSSTNYNPTGISLALIRMITAEDGFLDKVVYLDKINHGEIGFKLAQQSYISSLFPNSNSSSTFYIGDKCNQDYAHKLLPRAAAYSAALIDHFFRGKIEISPPDDGYYATVEDHETNPNVTDAFYTTIKLKAKNITSYLENEETKYEEMKQGKFKLVVRYRVLPGGNISDANNVEVNNLSEEQKKTIEYKFAVSDFGKDENNVDITSLPHQPEDDPVEIEFDFADSLIPVNSTDVAFIIVFKGTLGFEENNAVATGFLDVSESTPVDIYNNYDKVWITDQFYDSGTQAALDAADINGSGKIEAGSEAQVRRYIKREGYITFNPPLPPPPNGVYMYLMCISDPIPPEDSPLPSKYLPDETNKYFHYNLNYGEYKRFHFLLDHDQALVMSIKRFGGEWEKHPDMSEADYQIFRNKTSGFNICSWDYVFRYIKGVKVQWKYSYNEETETGDYEREFPKETFQSIRHLKYYWAGKIQGFYWPIFYTQGHGIIEEYYK